MEIEIKLIELLEQRGRTIYWLAKEVGIDFTTLYRLRDGKSKGIRFDLLANICKALECQPGELLVLGSSKPDSKPKKKGKA